MDLPDEPRRTSDLRQRALAETAKRAHGGSFLHLPRQLLIGCTSSLAGAEPLFF